MVKNPNLNALKMFDAAACHLNFGLAAEELNLTQGAVAQQVRKLEQELGVKLFHRLARGLALTDTGQSYASAVRKAMTIIEQATQKLVKQNANLKLSVPPSLASKWLVPKLKSFNQSHPDVKVEIIASEMKANFITDGVDLAIRMAQPPFAKGLNAQLLAKLRLCAVCSADYATRINEISKVEDLAGYELIHDHHSRWDEWISIPTKFNDGMRFNQTALAMDAAMAGQGIALVPFLLAQASFENGQLVELWRDEAHSAIGYYIICSELSEVRPNQQAMIDWLLAQVDV